jgi:hypothetical protein
MNAVQNEPFGVHGAVTTRTVLAAFLERRSGGIAGVDGESRAGNVAPSVAQ